MQTTTNEQPRLNRRLQRLLRRTFGRQAAEGRLLSAAGGKPIKTLLVTCPRPGDGASVASLGIAHALADSGLRVLWIDAHPSRPACSRYVQDLGEGPGLDQWLSGEVVADHLPATADPPSLFLCGQTSERSEAELRSADWPKRLDEAREGMDYIVIDAGDLRSGSWSAHCARMVDGVLVAASCRRNRTGDVEEAIQQLENLDAPLMGVILNRKKPILPRWLDAND